MLLSKQRRLKKTRLKEAAMNVAKRRGEWMLISTILLKEVLEEKLDAHYHLSVGFIRNIVYLVDRSIGHLEILLKTSGKCYVAWQAELRI